MVGQTIIIMVSLHRELKEDFNDVHENPNDRQSSVTIGGRWRWPVKRSVVAADDQNTSNFFF